MSKQNSSETTSRYPEPLKGQRVKCLGCNDGKVKIGSKIRNCKACKGDGYIVAK